MQAQVQSVQTVQISAAQSLAAVQTVLKAGLGCIAYLRNLLPEDHFTESHFTSSAEDSISFDEKNDDKSSIKKSERNINAFKIMTVMRGCSEEADKLLDHMERGIFEALQKQYLQRFVFGIHLDEADSNNIIEAYTFNFEYHSIPGTTEKFPIMSLGDGLSSLRLDPPGAADPVSEAVKKGKAPTILDVKRSVKALLRRLIQATTQMELLPQRRFATFKLIYNESTPADYEPPTFQTGDADRNKWYFTTHSRSEVPEKWNIGSMDSGHYSVSVNIASVASYLPSATAGNDALFLGTVSNDAGGISRQDIQPRQPREDKAQAPDAAQRDIVWDADLSDADAEGDDDPDYAVSAVDKAGCLHDSISSFPHSEDSTEAIGFSQENEAPCFGGTYEPIPARVADMSSRRAAIFRETEELQATQVIASPTSESMISALPTLQERISSDQMDVDTLAGSDEHDKIAATSVEASDSDSIEVPGYSSDSEPVGPNHPPLSLSLRRGETDVDHGLQCECEINIEDVSCIYCEGGCGRWFHIWCMGFHNLRDKRIPPRFKCFDCRVRADPLWDLIKTDIYPSMIQKFKDLATFRRAIKIAQKCKPTSLNCAHFTKSMGCGVEHGRALFLRLQSEGFVHVLRTTIDDFGLTQAAPKGKANRTQKTKPRATAQKDKFIFNAQSTRDAAYTNYFDPSEETEAKMLDMDEMKSQLYKTSSAAVGESQTQDETQYPFDAQSTSSTRFRLEDSINDSERPRKKQKVSVTLAVDLAE